jgi:WD40 repeat protein
MTHTGKKVQGYLTVRATRAVVSPNGQRAVVAAEVWTEFPEPASQSSGVGEGILELWDLTTGNRISILNQGQWQKTSRPVAFTPDSRVLLAFPHDRTGDLAVSLWDATTGRLLRKIPLWDNEFTVPPPDLAVFPADGKTLFTARPSFRENGSNVIRINNFASGREIRHWEYKGGQIHALAVSPDGMRLATAGNDHMIRLWDVTTGRELARWEAHESAVTALSFYPKGNVLASGAEDGSLKMWDLDGIRRELSSIGLSW